MSLGGPGFPQSRRRYIEFGSRSDFVVGRQSQSKSVTCEGRKHVQVDVKDVLPCRCAVGEKQI
jgi:hypothetical protein